jgi:hypothetical protein
VSGRAVYRFVSRWRVEGTCGEVADIIGDPLTLPEWWPSVYLRVTEIEPADARGLNRRLRLLTKGWLPYSLEWEFVLTRSDYPDRFEIEAFGDFSGHGVWTFVQAGPVVDITYDWSVSAEKPLLKNLTFLLRPVFEANHRWAMAQGEISLRLELARRRAASAGDRAAIPPPPGPVTYKGVALLAGAAAVGVGLGYLAIRATRRTRRSGNRRS